MNHALESALNHFTRKGSELSVGKKTLSELAKRYGTPVYIYFEEIIRKRHRLLRETLPPFLHIYFAVKANPNLEMLSIMNGLYDGFDVASAGEIERVISLGISPTLISFAGPGKTPEELEYAIANEIGCISVESEPEYETIKAICTRLKKPANLAVRVNPDFDLSQSGMKMGGGPKQFGVDSDRAPALVSAMASANMINFKGLHIFAGSQNLKAEELLQTFDNILEYAVSLSKKTGVAMQQVNMGGGFGIPYFAHDLDLDLPTLGTGLDKLLTQYAPLLGSPRFILELGRFLVGECGVYLSKVLYRKISRKEVFLIIDGGMHHHLAASGNLGQSLVRRPMPITVVNRQDAPIEKVHVAGPLCTPLDTFGFVDIPEAQPGDIIAVMQSGAYGFSASPQLFLSHPPPKEVIIRA